MGAAPSGLGGGHPVEVRAPSEFAVAFARMAAARVGAFIVQQAVLFVGNRALVIDAAIRPPGMYVFSVSAVRRPYVYGVNVEDLYRHAATYVDKILKSAKPGDLPIEQPTTFELVSISGPRRHSASRSRRRSCCGRIR